MKTWTRLIVRLGNFPTSHCRNCLVVVGVLLAAPIHCSSGPPAARAEQALPLRHLVKDQEFPAADPGSDPA